MKEKRNVFAKKAAGIVAVVAVILIVGCLVIKHSVSVPKEKEELYISILNSKFQYKGEDDMGFDLYGKNYLLPKEDKVLEEVEELIEEIDCYSTPKTIYKNIQSSNGIATGFSQEDSYEKSISFMWIDRTDEEKTSNIVIYENGYIGIGERYYSLGMKRKEKAKEMMEEIERYLEENAAQYCEEWEDTE